MAVVAVAGSRSSSSRSSRSGGSSRSSGSTGSSGSSGSRGSSGSSGSAEPTLSLERILTKENPAGDRRPGHRDCAHVYLDLCMPRDRRTGKSLRELLNRRSPSAPMALS